jgi:hypothetical protein
VHYDAHVTEEVRALAGLNLEGLRAEWRRRYGPPPRLRSSDLLAHLLAWRIQSDAFGGLDAATKRTLKAPAIAARAPSLCPGMRLEREWKGIKHSVEIVDGGFRWEGQTYASLTMAARAITGGKWNGPRFFGLREKAA